MRSYNRFYKMTKLIVMCKGAIGRNYNIMTNRACENLI